MRWKDSLLYAVKDAVAAGATPEGLIRALEQCYRLALEEEKKHAERVFAQAKKTL